MKRLYILTNQAPCRSILPRAPKMRTHIQVFLATCGLLLLVAGCRSVPQGTPAPHVQHVVVCWLKDPGNAAHCRKLIEASHTLTNIPGVLDMHAGTMLPSDREIVDSTFDVALVTTFQDARSMQDYIIHPLHEQLVRGTIKPLTKRVLVYDFVEH